MSDWNDVRVSMLRRLWGLGWTASKIRDAFAEQGISFTRHAIIGKANRLKLESRPCPIRHRADYDQYRPQRQPKKGGARAVREAIARTTKVVEPKPEPKPMAKIVRLPTPLMRVGSCTWPIGDPKEPGFHFCGAKQVVAGKPYCAEHCARAYQPIARAAE